MNFQYMSKIEDQQKLLDLAFKTAKSAADRTSAKYKRANPDVKARKVEQSRLDSVKKTLTTRLKNINTMFPSIDGLPPFYSELIKNCIDEDMLRKSLGSMKWAIQTISELHKQYNSMLSKAKTKDQIENARKSFFGRISSILRRINKHLIFLDSARKTMKQFPDIKTDMPTYAIAGYPNVGKSSLLKALTGSAPKIASYAFTTQSINVAYMGSGTGKIQLVDVPGTFDREKMNMIEMQAMLVMKHVAEKIVFVLDPSGSCGYPLEEQIGLLNRIRKMFAKDMMIVMNKSDLVEERLLADLAKKLQKNSSYPIHAISITQDKNISSISGLLDKLAA